MAVKCSSSGGNSAMKASLMLMLLFGSVVAAHATHPVDFYNDLCVSVYINDIEVKAGQHLILNVDVNISVKIKINLGGLLDDLLQTVCLLVGGVNKVVVVKVDNLVQLKVTGVDSLIGGLLGSLVCGLPVPQGLPCPVY